MTNQSECCSTIASWLFVPCADSNMALRSIAQNARLPGCWFGSKRGWLQGHWNVAGDKGSSSFWMKNIQPKVFCQLGSPSQMMSHVPDVAGYSYSHNGCWGQAIAKPWIGRPYDCSNTQNRITDS